MLPSRLARDRPYLVVRSCRHRAAETGSLLHCEVANRRQNQSQNNGCGDPDQPLLAFHPNLEGHG